MPDTVLFYAFAVLVLVAAFRVVIAKNLFHSALYLAAFLFGVAALYVLLNAYFIAAIQVLIYIGAVVVLTIFVISLTKNTEEKTDPRDWKARIRIAAGVIAGLLSFSLIAVIMMKSNVATAKPELVSNNSTNTIGNLLMGDLVLPFELVSVLLLAALLAAIAIVAKDREEQT